MSLAQLEILFCRVFLFKFEIDDGNGPRCIKDALVDACDQIEKDIMPRVD